MRLIDQQNSKLLDLAQAKDQELLMEKAGQAVASLIEKIEKNKKKKILILIGPGNNGADGFVAARILKRKSFINVRCAILIENEKGEIWKKQLEKAKLSEVEVEKYDSSFLKVILTESDLIIDAIFGTGLSKKIEGEVFDLMTYLNQKKRMVIAIDTPSGLNVDTGLVNGVAVKANYTVTFGLAKPGFFLNQGPLYVGALTIEKLVFTDENLKKYSGQHFAMTRKMAQLLIPKRSFDTHKYKNGVVYCFAGSDDYLGAGQLVSHSCYRAGAGLVYWLPTIKDSNKTSLLEKRLNIPDVIFKNADQVKFEKLKLNDVILLGPGFTDKELIKNLIVYLKKNNFLKVVLDAEAIKICAEFSLWPLPKTWILTPHSGELSHILNKKPEELNQDRLKSAKAAATKTSAIIVFKGFKTVVSAEEKNFIILTSHPALAKAGSGDVLAGLIAGFLAQNMTPIGATCLANYIHGACARFWLEQGKDKISLMATDLVQLVPEVIHQLRSKAKSERQK